MPEPLLDEIIAEDSGQRKIQSLETLSIAFMFMLERLSPKERAVFMLKEALDYQHDEIAHLLDLSTANSRQLLRRAREKTKSKSGQYPVDKEKHRILLGSFMEAIWNGDTEKLQQVLASDADWGAVLLVDKEVISLVTTIVQDNLIEEIYVMRNPEKLGRLSQIL